MSSFGEKLIRSAREAGAIARGELAPARTYTAPDVDVAGIRKRTGLSQAAFAQTFGFSVAAVKDWEQGRKTPEASARTLLIVIDREPAAVERALRAVA